MKLLRTKSINKWPQPAVRADCLGYNDDSRECCLVLESREDSWTVPGSGGRQNMLLEMNCRCPDAVAAALGESGVEFERGDGGEVRVKDPDGLTVVFASRKGLL